MKEVKRQNYMDKLFVFTILYFILGMINISLALLGFLCMILPLALYFYAKDKVWCKFYCPRAGLFNKLLKKISLNLKLPKWLTAKRTKKIVLVYYGINMFVAIMSSIMVAKGKAESMEYIRFLIFFKMPFNMPQLIELSLSPVLAHASYRMFSMMFTSTIIGLIFGILFRPRTWCLICPIGTITSIDISGKKVNNNKDNIKGDNNKKGDKCA